MNNVKINNDQFSVKMAMMNIDEQLHSLIQLLNFKSWIIAMAMSLSKNKSNFTAQQCYRFWHLGQSDRVEFVNKDASF